MAVIGSLPEEVFAAALEGEITTIKSWLLQGGDPDQGLDREFHDDGVVYEQGSTLLIGATSAGRLNIMRLLVVDHNADVNVMAGWTPLIYAIISRSADCVQFLLDRGANTSGIIEGTRIVHDEITYALEATPRVLRIILAAGVVLTTARISRVAHGTNFPVTRIVNGVVTVSLEEAARDSVRMIEENKATYGYLSDVWREQFNTWTSLVNRCTEVADILEGTRLAGHSYKRWVLKDYVALLRVRSLLARRRARASPETPEVAKRLFDGVPDPCFWKVIEYAWLGDWRQP